MTSSNYSESNDLKALKEIINSSGISRNLSEKFPKTNELLQWNLEKTAAVLCAEGCIQLFQIKRVLHCPHTGTDNLKTWSEYKKSIIDYLRVARDDIRLKKAYEALAEYIHDQHFEKFPFWPDIGTEQESKIFIDTVQDYDDKGYYVTWSCLGFIHIRDYRADSSEYSTEFYGRPQVKILYSDEAKLADFEKHAVEDMDRCKQKIAGTVKSISWDTVW